MQGGSRAIVLMEMQAEIAKPARMESEQLKKDQRAYVRAVLDALGITATELARRAGVAATTLTRFMNKIDHGPNLSATTMRKIEQASGIKAPDLTYPTLPPVTDAITLPVLGAIAAGVWREVQVQDDKNGWGTVPVAPLPRYAGKKQYALLVEGPSINRRIKSGDYAVCVAFEDMPGGFENGQYLHVERYRGGMVEATIKRVRYDADGQVELWPDSDHPAHQKPILYEHDDQDTSVEVKGVVIGSFASWE